MKFYFAGSFPPKYLDRKAEDNLVARNFLATYADKALRRFAEKACLSPDRRLFVDSGAFSVWTLGKSIDVDEYIEFCLHIKQIAKCPVVFAALDVIPGTYQKRPTDKERDVACEKGWENYEYMRKKGVECLMTFHQFETKDWLKKIVDSADYICISTRKRDVPNDHKMEWFKEVFRYLPTDIKIHGLGISSARFMSRFPFYSVDSSGWIQSGRMKAYSTFDEKELRVLTIPFSKWENDLENYGIPNEGRYAPGGEHVTSGEFGTYFYINESIKAYLLLERCITAIWQNREVFWDDEPRLGDEELVKYAKLAMFDRETACGKITDGQQRIPGCEEDGEPLDFETNVLSSRK